MGEQRPEYITITDDAGRRQQQKVKHVVTDVKGETIYVTVEGLQYTHDSLGRKRQGYLIDEMGRIPAILSRPDIVTWDPMSPTETRLYYKRVLFREKGYQLLTVVVKIRQDIRFFYNFYRQISGKVKGYREKTLPVVWYIAPGQKRRTFGL